MALVRAGEIIHVIDAFACPAKEARSAVLGNIAARRYDTGLRQQTPAEIEELVFVAARAVKDEEERVSRLLGLVNAMLITID